MTLNNQINIEVENAICYSGYREGQSPNDMVYPSYEQVKEDLLILARHWKLLRLYESDNHAETVLEVIRREKIDLKVMIGVCLGAEINNENCPWGANYTEVTLSNNKDYNKQQIEKLIRLANHYSELVISVSAGNEATAEWTDHLVPVETVIAYVKLLKSSVKQPVTFCENYAAWQGKLHDLAEEVDFISLHTYPLWEYKSIEEALDYTQANYNSVRYKYPHKPVIITEAGWATNSNDKGIPSKHANEEFQKTYYEKLTTWSRENGILTFVFEAFDEAWKGSHEPLEPEKHWGLFTIDRKPKKVMCDIYPDLCADYL